VLGALCLICLLWFQKPHASATVSGPAALSYLKGLALGAIIAAIVPLVFRSLRLSAQSDAGTEPEAEAS
jgi:hypothetical protein